MISFLHQVGNEFQAVLILLEIEAALYSMGAVKMNIANKNKYLSKSVVFAGKKVTLFSMDGDTWSSRADELELIKERHEQEKANYGGQIKGGPQAGIPAIRHKASSVKAQYAQSLKEEQSKNKNLSLKKAEDSAANAGATTGNKGRQAPAAQSSPAKGRAADILSKKPGKEAATALRKHASKGKAALPVKKKEAAPKAAVKASLPKPKARASSKPVKAPAKSKARKGTRKQ